MDSPSQTNEPSPAQDMLLADDDARQQTADRPSNDTPSPPNSSTSSPKSMAQRRTNSPLSLDLKALPQLSQPSPPSNTLLITQLNDFRIFHPASLATIRQHITSLAPLHSFSPLKSFRRIVCSFYDVDSAIRVRQHLDDVALLGEIRARVYFGEPTPIGETKKYLERPDAGRLFFISPPPSPPMGWEVREEGAPNKEVVAIDLVEALGKLSGKMEHSGEGEAVPDPAAGDKEMAGDGDTRLRGEHGEDAKSRSPLRIATTTTTTTTITPNQDSAAPPNSAGAGLNGATAGATTRSRSSTVIYSPEAHGDSPALPAVMVEDTTMAISADADAGALNTNTGSSGTERISMTHTPRPPVELMGQDV